MGLQEKKWSKPQLVVLARGLPGESVLVSCKNSSRTGSGTDITNCKGFDARRTRCNQSDCSVPSNT